LLGVETDLDPAMLKSDGLAGNVLGHKGELPKVTETLEIKVELMDRLVGSEEDEEIDNIKEHEPLMLNIGTTKTAGVVTQAGKHVRVDLKMPVSVEEEDRVAISRQIESRWRLIGHGTVNSTE
jgi:translation initiation factor 2 subunit 3